MKKLILLLSFLILMLCTYSFKPVFANIFKQTDLIFGNISYSVYCLNVNENIENSEVINIGNGFIVNSSASNAKYVKSKVSNILGESIKFKSTFTKIEKIISLYNIEIIKEEKIGEIYSFYGYSTNKDFNSSIKVDNKNVNIQLAYNNGIIVIGYPIILGDY